MKSIILEETDSSYIILLKILDVSDILTKIKEQVTDANCKSKLSGCLDSLFATCENLHNKDLNYEDLKSEVFFVNRIIEYTNKVMASYSLKEVVLKSLNPDEYSDLVIVCKVIPNDKIGEYLGTIPEGKKFYAHKNGLVSARIGVPGEIITTTLTTIIDGKEYILTEEDNIVKERVVGKDNSGNDIKMTDIVVVNEQSTSNEQYVVKAQKFYRTYKEIGHKKHSHQELYMPQYDSRLLTQVDENVIIMTSWGAPAVCLAGSYIVTYNAEENDYNTIERGAFESTYTIEEQPKKKIKR